MSKKLVKVADCEVEGHERDWVEFDTTEWTALHYREIMRTNVPLYLSKYVEGYVCAWSITGLDGAPVPFPGQSADDDAWLEAYSQVDLEFMSWLSLTPITALNERMNPPPKSAGGNTRQRTKRRAATA